MASQGQSPPVTLPTLDEKDALVGSHGSPSASNPYVTDSDPRNSDARAPAPHASTHAPGGSDPLVLGQPQGLTKQFTAVETLQLGMLVFRSGGGVGRADSSNPARMPAFGVVTEVSGSLVTVQSAGFVDFSYTGTHTGRAAFVGSSGFPVDDPTGLAYVQAVGFWAANNTLALSLAAPIVRAS